MPRIALAVLATLVAAAVLAVGSAAAATLPADSTALLSGAPSLFDALAAPVNDSEIEQDAVSEDGRYVAFSSKADGLVDVDDDRNQNVYRKDMKTGEVELMSRRTGAGGEPAHDDCLRPAISDDGRRVAFACFDALDPIADKNGLLDVYVRTPETGTTQLVSRLSATGVAGNGNSYDPVLSQDGDAIAFTSDATDLGGGPTTVSRTVYLRRLSTGTTIRVARRDGATGAHVDGNEPSITDDGSMVAFSSADPADPAVDNNTVTDVYLRDVVAGTTTLVSRADGKDGAVGDGYSYRPAISGNGLGVVFQSAAKNLDVRGGGAGGTHIYRRVLGLFRTSVVDITAAGAISGTASAATIDDSSTVVGFISTSDKLDPADTGDSPDAYVKNVLSGSVDVVSRTGGPGGKAANRAALRVSLSGDAYKVATELEDGGITTDADPRHGSVIMHDLDEKTTVAVSRPVGTAPFLNAAGDNTAAQLSDDGRYAAFTSDAAGLGLPASVRTAVVVRDRVTGEVTIASREDGPDGGPFEVAGSDPAISADGRRVAFTATPSPSVPRQVWVRDLDTGRTSLASRTDGANGEPANATSRGARLDADGSRVVFRSDATNLDGEDKDSEQDIFVRDLDADDTILVSRADGPAGAKGDGSSEGPDIDAAGERVVFLSVAKNLVGADTDTQRDAFVRDLGAGTTRLVNTTAAGVKGNGTVDDLPTIDAAGAHVAFVSAATNLGDASPQPKVFVRELGGDLKVVGPGIAAVLSPDGGYVGFERRPADTPRRVFRHDLASGATDLVSRAGGAAGREVSTFGDLGDISAGGACVSFVTNDALVGPARDTEESYVRVFKADCGDVAPVDQAGGDGGDGPIVGGGPGAARDTVAPVLSRVRLSRRRFRAVRGTLLRLRSSEAATLTIRVSRVGRRGRTRRVGTLSRRIAAGAVRVRIGRRIGRRATLRPGRYRLRVVASDAAGNRSRAVVRRFVVVGR
jgi:Tol biopolymer transport system component